MQQQEPEISLVQPAGPTEPEDLSAKYNRRLTPLGNAERLILRHGERFRYCAETGEFLVWADQRWYRDSGAIRMHRFAKDTVKDLALCNGVKDAELCEAIRKWAHKSETEPMLMQMLELVRSDRNVVISKEQLDQHPDLLCCTNGVIHLATGELLPNRPDLYLTRSTNTPYVPEAFFEPWERFLREMTGGQERVKYFLQVAMGYTLPGSTKEEVFFLLHGPGATGKSTFLEATIAAMGEYAATANFATFLRKDRQSSSGPSEDIAKLAGARLVTATEVNDGQRFDEATLKSMTGGDAISARFLYQNSFTYRPQLKLWFAVNHLPFMATDDPAIWRRIIRVSCDHRPREVQKNLKALFATQEARTAILAWAVRGAVEWYRTGLVMPTEIQAANAHAKEEMDPIAVFLNEECVTGPSCLASITQFRQRYDEWAAANGQRYVLDRRRFDRALETKGLVKGIRRINDKKTRCWIGVMWIGQDEEMRDRILAVQHRDQVQDLFGS